MNFLRLMLVDDSAAFLAAAQALVSGEPHIQVVARCRDGAEALVQTRAHRPDLVLMDVMMPGMNGLEATRLLKAHAPTLRVILVSLHDHAELHASAREAGAERLLNKADLAVTLPPLLAARA